jgi:hypothetical protein
MTRARVFSITSGQAADHRFLAFCGVSDGYDGPCPAQCRMMSVM